ncbi:MAG: hypothetical protein A3J54_03450 [Candidatus Ryanbacteria bacterium RIFCSPHIGHO2_02_FULL_45_13b]|uniref:Uncharacterized protein n=1 Tax=Candidatus Ryanbacteria bacterium RIFCSPHIGHO2_02_FULL_45_13b TaxID=1802117 RepID=A0A1G2GBQ7_9BACT|nr:MAG: hypothetical protein A3J54_03450 [Candidatus Ryanbacteria bacterium RIFCSPHIGHO2_02_FULL_45_13b]
MNNQIPAQLFTSFTSGIKNFFTDTLFPFLALLSVILFLWGVVTAVTTQADDQRDEGKRLMTYGLIGFAIFTILWGLFYFSLAPEIVPTNPALLQKK